MGGVRGGGGGGSGEDTVLVQDELCHPLTHSAQSDSGVDGDTSSLLHLERGRDQRETKGLKREV